MSQAAAAATPVSTHPGHRRRRHVAAQAGLAVLLIGSAATALTVGAVSVGPGEPFRSLGHHTGLLADAPPNDGVLWAIRIPRVALAVIVGAALGLGGVALQGLYRTRLADPQLLGIGPGAAIGAVIGTSAGGIQGGIAGGAVAGLLTALLVRRMGRAGHNDPTRFVLVGVALASALSAWVGFLVFGLDRSVIPSIDFWLLGSVAGATWRAVATVAVLAAIGGLVIAANGRTLDVLTLGEANASAVGVDVALTQTVVLMAVGVTTGAAVGAVGVVGFIGLIAPAAVDRLTGPRHRIRLIAASMVGATLVVIADTVARTAVAPIELPVGLVTAAVGGPVFVWLISRARTWT